MHTFNATILTPDETVFTGEVFSMTVPTTTGQITVLAGHNPLVTVVTTGEVRVKLKDTEGKNIEQSFHIEGGVLDVKDHNKGVTLLSDGLISIDDYKDVDLHLEIDRAKQIMKEKGVDHHEYDEWEGAVEKHAYIKKLMKK
jgi:F-type H+-transporting ATPase subunit epsilon